MNYYKMNRKIEKEDLESFQYPNRKIGVIAHIVDELGNILLQQRGMKSRDENGLYEDVGGRAEEYDSDFTSAIIREMAEEMGTEVNVEFEEPIGIYHVEKNDINWVFIIFYVKYIGGEIKIMEPDKCLGYKFFHYEEIMTSSLVSESCKYLKKCIKEEYLSNHRLK